VVITQEHALKLLVEANPVPDLSELDLSRDHITTSLAELDTRSSEMHDIEYERTNTKPISGRWRRMGIAAALAVLVAAGIFLLRTTDKPPVAGQPPTTAVEVATAFVDAYAVFDVDLATIALAADADLSQLHEGEQDWRLGNRWLQATGAQILITTCEEVGSLGVAVTVRCPYNFYALRSNEIGLGPYSGSYFELAIANGEVTSAAMRWEFVNNGFSKQVWEPFAGWVSTTHSEDMPTMYRNGNSSAVMTEESIDLWEQRLREYVAEVNGEEAGVLHGLPSVGATPSTPETGELVASMWEHISQRTTLGNGWLYLYEDGRLIVLKWDGNPDPTDGWVEQRLTAEGVELIRTELATTGLFDPDQATLDRPGGRYGASYVQVRNGDKLVYIAGEELRRRLGDLWSWLPADAWEDTEAKPFVPSRYAACMQSAGYPRPIDPTDHLPRLPAASRDLLAGARPLHGDELVNLDPAGMESLESTAYCYVLTTEEAREFASTLAEGGVELLRDRDDGIVFNLLEDTWLDLWPMLPHGVPAFTGA
jgi:hypothetical protein